MTTQAATSSSSPAERRRHSRLELKAYGFSHRSAIHHNGSSLDVYLIDISPGGARVRVLQPGSSVPAILSIVRFDSMLSLKDERLNGLESSVRWQAGDEFGLRFEQELSIAASDLQVLLTP